MQDLFWALVSGAMFGLAALLLSGALAGEYHDVESAVAWVSSLSSVA